LNSVKVDYGLDPVALPYDSGSLSAVLSVGVLEHVPDIDGSLKEVNRVLRPQGCFFLFMFPNLYSWAEWIADRRGISVHPRKFTVRETSSLLRSHAFQVETKWRRNFLPRNLTGFPARAKAAYGRFYRQIEAIDRILANIPPTSYFSGVLEFVARKHE
jgi:SAM-dependent methyltransferase